MSLAQKRQISRVWWLAGESQGGPKAAGSKPFAPALATRLFGDAQATNILRQFSVFHFSRVEYEVSERFSCDAIVHELHFWSRRKPGERGKLLALADRLKDGLADSSSHAAGLGCHERGFLRSWPGRTRLAIVSTLAVSLAGRPSRRQHRQFVVITRRSMLSHLALLPAVSVPGLLSRARVFDDLDLPPIRAITRKPGHHWFGYYDKFQFDSSDRYALGMRVSFEGRTPKPDDEIIIGMVDLEDGDRWIDLGTSSAWGWQQGCMLQWRPGHKDQVIWNDREQGRYVCRIHDVKSGKQRTVPYPIYSVGPSGEVAVSADFRRIQALRPGYGYVGFDDPNGAELIPSTTGVFRVDLEQGTQELIIPLDQIAAIEPVTKDMVGAKHYVNHLLMSPNGERFIFLHRWRPNGGKGGFRTRMFTSDLDGKNLHLLDPSGRTSHFIWRDDEHVAAWSVPKGKPAGFYVFRDRSDEVEALGAGS